MPWLPVSEFSFSLFSKFQVLNSAQVVIGPETPPQGKWYRARVAFFICWAQYFGGFFFYFLFFLFFFFFWKTSVLVYICMVMFPLGPFFFFFPFGWLRHSSHSPLLLPSKRFHQNEKNSNKKIIFLFFVFDLFWLNLANWLNFSIYPFQFKEEEKKKWFPCGWSKCPQADSNGGSALIPAMIMNSCVMTGNPGPCKRNNSNSFFFFFFF